jgi:PAS domain S-box-containing protein
MTEIIIVDDRVTNRNILHRLSAMLEPEASIHDFAEAKSAIEHLKSHGADLIITDFKMPEINGAEFIHHCRTNIPNFDAPIIVVTAYEDKDFRYEALEAGATEFLLSPIDHREFVTRVRNVLSMHRQSRELKHRTVNLEIQLDDTAAKHAAEVERNAKRLRSIVDSNSNLIYTTSAKGEITIANGPFAAACGLSPEDMIDRPMRHIVPDHFFVERMLLGDDEVRTRRAPTRGEIKFSPAHGSDMYMQVSKALIEGPDKNDVEVLTVLTDITQRRAAEEMLSAAKRAAETANAAKSAFLANMSHELRTPLNAVIGFGEVMMKEMKKTGQDTLAQYCEHIIDGGQHLLSIISDVLDMAQIEAGKMSLREGPVNLAALFEITANLVHHTAEQYGSHLVFDCPDNLPTLYVDEAKFRQILVNIADNGLKYSKKGGQVKIAVRSIGEGGLVIEVEDNGIGMSEAEIEIAYSRFGRVGPALLSKPGTGLGLPLSVDLIRLHGGNISITSKPDIGTKVSITLPPERVINDASIKVLKSALGHG